MNKLSNKMKLYIFSICILASILLIYFFNTYDIVNIKVLIFFAILSIIAESFAIPLPNGGAVSVGFAISLAVIIIAGPPASALVTATGFMFRFPKVKGKGFIHIFNTPFYKTIFNVAQSIVMTGISGIVYVKLGGVINPNEIFTSFYQIIAAVFVYMVINTSIIAQLMSLLSGQSFIKNWTNNIKGMIPSVTCVALLGIIIAHAYITYGFFAVILFFGPLLLARYSFKLYMDMRKVYMETITALTKAVEAKDPYTSGHACRVGEYAIKLAQELKLPDNRIERIKTAAILHDIGKIGINDSILNKPGRLTEEEYDKIKEHPLIGAEIVDDIDFLKDVTNVIKYHHERFDGRGYPEGIDGENIPLEAAILSIADVFDAMTSDRPYRKALSTEEALFEIESNSGTQFHPKLADTFVELVRKDIKKEILAHVN